MWYKILYKIFLQQLKISKIKLGNNFFFYKYSKVKCQQNCILFIQEITIFLIREPIYKY